VVTLAGASPLPLHWAYRDNFAACLAPPYAPRDEPPDMQEAAE